MNTQIPLYRAEVIGIGKMSNSQVDLLKEIDGRFYAIGFYSFLDDEHGITDLKGYYWEVKVDTRSISFINMVDKNSKRIFASINEDGVGGDSFGCENDYWWLKFDGQYFKMMDSDDYEDQHDHIEWKYLEVIGIHKG